MGQGPQKPEHGGNFYMMPRRVQDSVSWRCLSLRARAVFSIFMARHDGFNNGRITVSIKQLGQAIGDQNHGGNARAIAELIEHGFLECVSDANRRQSLAREYRITCIPTGDGKTRKMATHEYADWRPGPMKRKKFGGARTATPEPISVAATATTVKFPVAVTATGVTEIRGVEAGDSTAVTAPHLYNHSSEPQSRSIGPEIVGRGIDTVATPLDELRDWLKACIEQIGYGGQKKLALAACVPEPTVSRFRQGKGLPEHHRLALQTACGRTLAYRKWKTAA